MNVQKFKRIANRRAQKGITMIEYALIAAVVAVAIIGAWGAFGDSLKTLFTNISQDMTYTPKNTTQ